MRRRSRPHDRSTSAASPGEGDKFAAGVFVSLDNLTLVELLASSGIMRPKRDPSGRGALVSPRADVVGGEPRCRWRRTLLSFTPFRTLLGRPRMAQRGRNWSSALIF